jgi:hypothetical protein
MCSKEIPRHSIKSTEFRFKKFENERSLATERGVLSSAFGE